MDARIVSSEREVLDHRYSRLLELVEQRVVSEEMQERLRDQLDDVRRRLIEMNPGRAKALRLAA